MAGADVRVRVRRRIVVHVEQPVIQVLVIVATSVKARVRRVEVPVIARMPNGCTGDPVLYISTLEGADPLKLPLKGVPGGDSRG